MQKKLVLTTLALGVGASSASAAPFPIAGSDTLRELSIDVLAACPAPGGGVLGDGTAAAKVAYAGGGSTVGGLAMSGNTTLAATQQLAPQSRFMNTAECQVNNPAGAANTGT